MAIPTVPRIVFHVGGPAFHPVADQATQIIEWLGPGHRCELLDGVDALEPRVLDGTDLLVLMGLHWTGMTGGTPSLPYRPMGESHRAAFERYVRGGKPILAHHGAVASYDDWPRFGELVGVAWVWGKTNHSPIDSHTVRVLGTGHPVVRDVRDYTLVDELYYDLKLADGLRPDVHAEAQWDGAARPMVMTAEGGRVDGAGKVVYLANGHDLRAFEAPALRQLWVNSIRWLLEPR